MAQLAPAPLCDDESRMDRRQFLALAPAAGAPISIAAPETACEPHFPSRLCQYVWRNWELANADRMAKVVRAGVEDVLALGASMGLPAKRTLTADQLRRLYITVIRQNWRLLPNRQIIELLGWTPERFAFTLKEDDFLDHKLGQKPPCEELLYAPPTAEERRQAARIRRIVGETMGAAVHQRGEALFDFVRDLSAQPYQLAFEPGARVEEGEIDLRAGWSLEKPQDPVLASAGERFLKRAGSRGAGAGRIRLVLGQTPESFEVTISRGEVRITAPERAGILQALYHLEDEMERRGGPFLKIGSQARRQVWTPRLLYSYFALYGDPLAEPDIDPFPDPYLERLAREGINGVWMQAVLSTLAPSRRFPEFGAGAARRLETLRALVRRAGQFGVRVYLYLNEPRAMPAAFFEKRPELRGSPFQDFFSMCTSAPEVREWIGESLRHVFAEAPELGGIFTITMSENHTNCFSHGGAWGAGAPSAPQCPRCSRRQSWDVIGELIRTFRDAIRKVSATADVIAWDWGWGDALADRLIPLLPRDVKFQSISEWSQPVHRGGISTMVGEYSISVPGPGPRATRNWGVARQAGLKTMAKVQFNNTWEISAVPYIPVPQLVLEHCRGLSQAGVAGLLASWTCGGYPSPNLAAAKAFYATPRAEPAEILEALALRRYGRAAAEGAVEAWRQFSEAFREFPYGVAVYVIPTQHGPANLLRLRPSGVPPSMILFPQDDVKRWSGAYPPEVAWRQFEKVADGFERGLTAYRAALAKAPQSRGRFAALDLAVAETCCTHFRSTANQFEFNLLRDKPGAVDRLRALAAAEIELARRQFAAARRHSEIAFEATNHYYYTPLDLVEKILNCRHILDREIPNAGERAEARPIDMGGWSW